MTIATLQTPSPESMSKKGGRVRAFVSADISQVSNLHWRVSQPAGATHDAYRQFFSDVFAPATEPNGGIGSIVYEEADGSIVGFQGVHPRRMTFEGRPIVAAVCSHFVVDAGRRGVPGLRLLKTVMNGPQDLTLADESNDTARRLWEWCGGTTALLYSMHWVRPVRVVEAGLTILLGKRSPRAERVARPVARLADRCASAIGFNPLRTFAPSGSREKLDDTVFCQRLPEFASDKSLQPDYSDGSLQWILTRARTRRAGGDFQQVVVHDGRGEIAGWFLYFANRGGVGEVLQIAARSGAAGMVLDHLLDDARVRGVVALSGRLDPAYAHEMSQRHFLFFRRGSWALVHSRDARILAALERGDAFFSRLEGEWCLRFQ